MAAIAVRFTLFTALWLLLSAGATQAINLEYSPHAPAYSVGYEQIHVLDGLPPFVHGGGDPAVVFGSYIDFGPLESLESVSSITTDVTAPGSGPSDTFSVLSPSGGGAFYIDGITLPGGGLYDGENGTFSAEGVGAIPGVATRTIWDIEVLSTGELAGTPVEVEVVALIQGFLSANKETSVLDDAKATWKVYADGSKVIEGGEVHNGAGATAFHDDNTLSPLVFLSAVGSTFTLEINYLLEVNGEVSEANSHAEVTTSYVTVTATVVPEPSTFLLVAGGIGAMAVGRGRRG